MSGRLFTGYCWHLEYADEAANGHKNYCDYATEEDHICLHKKSMYHNRRCIGANKCKYSTTKKNPVTNIETEKKSVGKKRYWNALSCSLPDHTTLCHETFGIGIYQGFDSKTKMIKVYFESDQTERIFQYPEAFEHGYLGALKEVKPLILDDMRKYRR